MDIAFLCYLLFTIPGFCFVWTFRHFTKSKKIGDFEYAAWSFVWGTPMFASSVYLSEDLGKIVFDLNDPFKLLATSLGMGLGLSIILSFPLGFVTATLHSIGLFPWIDKMLFTLIEIFKLKKRIRNHEEIVYCYDACCSCRVSCLSPSSEPLLL